jgi:tetratricopeptide (TPR) repeat protein
VAVASDSRIYIWRVLSAAAAYRKDLLTSGCQSFGPSDDSWIAVASVLQLAAGANDERGLIAKAARIAVGANGKAKFRHLAHLEFGHDFTDIEAILLLVRDAEEAGARHLALTIAETLLTATTLEPLQYGRTLWLRARVIVKLSSWGVSEKLYRELDAFGKREGLPELRVRALNGFLALAQLRGNFPEYLRLARRGVRMVAGLQLPRLQGRLHHSVVYASMKFRLYDQALEHAWEMLELSHHDSVDEARSLSALGQIALEIGQNDAAIAAFAATLTRRVPPAVVMPTLGGLAVAAARSRQTKLLEWAIDEVSGAGAAGSSPYTNAAALIECASALIIAGRGPEASRLRQQGLRIAEEHRYNELVIQAEALAALELPPSPAPPRLKAAGANVIRAVEELAPSRLPKHVRTTRVTAGSTR